MKLVVADVVGQLLSGDVHSPAAAQPPSVCGFYAWWCRRRRLADASPAIPYEVRPPVMPEWSLLYVGISPSRASSTRNIARRFSRDHVGGNIGGSTFRQSIAALLMGHLTLAPRAGSDRSRLLSEAPLSAWIENACGVTFARADRPWELESLIISHLNPPLNIDQGTHPFRLELKAQRLDLRRACSVCA